MANNIWKMLDDMADKDPDSYKKFIEKNINEGITDAKTEKEKKEKPYRIIPKEGMFMEMDAVLNERVLEERPNFSEKVDLNKEKWGDVKAKFLPKVRINLSICSSERVKKPAMKMD